MTLKLFEKHIFGVKTLGFCHMRNINSVISKRFPNSGLSILMNGVISLPDATSYDNLQCGPYGYFFALSPSMFKLNSEHADMQESYNMF